jgi:hypothetical protein
MRENSQAAAVPSWPRVIATTLRLWLIRHFMPSRERPARVHPSGEAVAGVPLAIEAPATDPWDPWAGVPQVAAPAGDELPVIEVQGRVPEARGPSAIEAPATEPWAGVPQVAAAAGDELPVIEVPDRAPEARGPSAFEVPGRVPEPRGPSAFEVPDRAPEARDPSAFEVPDRVSEASGPSAFEVPDRVSEANGPSAFEAQDRWLSLFEGPVVEAPARVGVASQVLAGSAEPGASDQQAPDPEAANRGAAAREAPDRTKWVIVAVVVMIAAAAIGTEIATARSADKHPGPTASASPPNVALVAAARNRQQAAAWISAQVSPGVIVSCDPLMCSALQQYGFPASNEELIGPSAWDPLGSGIVVSTAAVRNQIGPRLASVYAPVVIASFGGGASLVQVRVIAPDGAAAQLSINRSDELARKAAGLQLLHNKNIHLQLAGKRQLAQGQVDSRLLITLSGLASNFPVYIRQFGDAGPGASAGTPLRSMTIDAWVRIGHRPPASYQSMVLAFLRAQRSPLRARTQVVGNGTKVALRIEFTAPSLPGLLGPRPQS